MASLKTELFTSSNFIHFHSIQRAAVWVLEQYYQDFPVYNPALLHIPSRSARMKQLTSQNFKVYDVDGKNLPCVDLWPIMTFSHIYKSIHLCQGNHVETSYLNERY